MPNQNIHSPEDDLRKFLWNECDKRVLIGYEPDFRLCDEAIETVKLSWNTTLDKITFSNGMVMSIRKRTIRGRRAYLYDPRIVGEEWMRRKVLIRARSLLQTLTDEVLKACVWNIGRSAGRSLPAWWHSRSDLLEYARRWLGHLSTAELEALAELLSDGQTPRPTPVAVAA